MSSRVKKFQIVHGHLSCSSFSPKNDRVLLRFQIFPTYSVDRKHLMFQSEKAVFKLLRGSVGRKHLMCFQSEKAVFKLLRGGVDRKHSMCFQSEKAVFKLLRGSVDRKTFYVFSE